MPYGACGPFWMLAMNEQAPSKDIVAWLLAVRRDYVPSEAEVKKNLQVAADEIERLQRDLYEAEKLIAIQQERIAHEPPAEPVAWQYRVNGVHVFYTECEPPPDDAYDAGTLVPLYSRPPLPPRENDAGAAFETVLGLIRPQLQRRLGDFDALQILQTVRDEWHSLTKEPAPHKCADWSLTGEGTCSSCGKPMCSHPSVRATSDQRHYCPDCGTSQGE
jgi:hypothetical protein